MAFRSRPARGFLSLVLIFVAAATAVAEPVVTEVMSEPELNAYIERLDGERPDGKGYFESGNWITGIEGFWSDGMRKFRLSYDKTPAHRACWWYWYLNQDRESFGKLVHRLADEGFQLVQWNSFIQPGGAERFQGVWHLLIPATGAAPLSAGKYQLVEVDRRPVTESLLSIAIDGEQLSGVGPTLQFKCSAKDGFTVKPKTEPGSDLSAGAAPDEKQRQEETKLLKRMENARWHESEGKLRVVQNGRTVLRFEKEEAKLEPTKSATVDPAPK